MPNVRRFEGSYVKLTLDECSQRTADAGSCINTIFGIGSRAVVRTRIKMNISSTFRVIIFVSVASVLVVNASPSPDMIRDANFRFGKFFLNFPFFFFFSTTYDYDIYIFLLLKDITKS